MAFSPNTRNRCWVGTIHVTNMKKAGLSKEEYENPEYLAEKFISFWEESGKGRKAGIAVCVSIDGCYHCHVACYGNTTSLKAVSDVLYQAHIEPQLAGKEALTSYLLKEGAYAEKGEQVLYSLGLENVQDNQGKRSDIEDIADLLEQGFTPIEVMSENFAYRKYEKMIKSAYIDKRTKETPIIKETYNEWHVGNSGCGKTYYYFQLCEKYEPEKIYMATDFENGGFDFYIEQGAPPILFLDEFKGNMKYSQLLMILDKYSRTQTHCRYTNTYNLWTTCIITSIFPPDEVYSLMVHDDKKSRDKIDQLLRRLDVIVYHYMENGEYKTFSIPASEYINYDDLKQRALGNLNGFVEIEDQEEFDLEWWNR